MPRAIKLNLDVTYEVFDLKPYPHLHEVIGDFFDIAGLTPAGLVDFPYVGIAVNDTGLIQDPPLKPNMLATSIRGLFQLQQHPLVGPACVTAADYEGEQCDVPDWMVELVKTVSETMRTITKGVQESRRG